MSAKKIILLFVLANLWLFNAKAQDTDTLFQPKYILKTMERVADWQLNTWKTKGSAFPKWDWTNAAGYPGIFELGAVSKNDAYLNYLLSVGNDLDWNPGPRRFMADDYCIGQTYANLYMLKKDPKMLARFKALADSIIAQPHTEPLV